MDVAVIDWKDSKFVKDEALENINAPQWVDFNAPLQPVDDDSWFCKPDCNHPKTVDDFLKNPPSKLQRSASVSEILPFGDRTRREAALKKRGLLPASSAKESKLERLAEDRENQNPNLSTPLKYKAKLKEAIKSSAEKQFESISLKDEKPKLKSTLSARNLFAGRDLLNQISDFCSDLKKLALRAKERENMEHENPNKTPVAVQKNEEKECSDSKLKIVVDDRKPLLEAGKEKSEVLEKSNGKEKLRRKIRNEDTENTPIVLDLKYKGCKEENLAQIRTNPPSPQCFSAKRGVTSAALTPTAFKPRTQERGILQELELRKDVRKDAGESKGTPGRMVPLPAEREPAKTLDVFWFLKPCTLAS
ncbi:hypothetical protein ACET3Z_031256 [Daucus carota]